MFLNHTKRTYMIRAHSCAVWFTLWRRASLGFLNLFGDEYYFHKANFNNFLSRVLSFIMIEFFSDRSKRISPKFFNAI